MKILIISEYFPTQKDLKFSGGVEARNIYHVKYLAKKHKVVVITSNQGKEKRIFKNKNLTIFRVGPGKKYQAKRTLIESLKNLKFIFEAIKFGATIDFDLVEGTNFLTHAIALRIGKKKKRPILFWYPDVYLNSWIKNYGLFQGLFGELLERINLNSNPNAYVAISKSTKKKLIDNEIDPKKIFVVECGVDKSEFKKIERKFKNKTIIAISRLVKYKNLDILLFAFQKLVLKYADLSLIIVGSGPQKNHLISLSKKLRINTRVKYLSNLKRKELISLLKRSHLFCLPSLVEGFGISVIESAAAGVPYLVSNIPVFREVTKNGHGGVLFNPDDYNQLQTEIEKFFKDGKYYDKKSNDSIELANKYDWKEITERTVNIYKKIISDYEKR